MEGNGYAVSEEAIAALENMSTAIVEQQGKLDAETSKLLQTFEANQSGLGAHAASIRALIEEVQQTGEAASRPVKILALKLTKAAVLRRIHREKNRYQGQSQSHGRSR